MNKVITFLTIIGTFWVASCTKDSDDTPNLSPITLSVDTDLMLEVGQTSQSITIAGGDGKTFRIVNTNAAIAEITQQNNAFTVQALKAGETLIVINSGGKSKELKVIVSVPSISLGEVTSPLELKVGESKSITLSGGDEKEFSVTASAPELLEAVVSEKILTVKALKAGNVTLTITSAGKTVQLEVVVTNILIEKIEIEAEHDFQPGNQSLFVKIYPENATEKTLIWESSDTNIVRVVNNATGEIYVNPRYGASATLTVKTTDGSGVVAQHLINVVKLVKNITILGGNRPLAVGVNFQLTTEIEPYDATQTALTWESSAPEVVSVDNQGNIRTLKEGRATISARSTDGSYISDQIEIKVILAIDKVSIDQASNNNMLEIKKGKHPLSISIWSEEVLKESGITRKSKSGYGSVSWQIVNDSGNNTAIFGWKNGETHILEALKTGQVTIKASYYDTLTEESISSQVITVIIKD